MSTDGDYLRNEVALDFADGLITRREALRRLGLLGLSSFAASTLLAACSPKSTTGGGGPTPSASAPGAGSGEAVPTEAVDFPGPSGTLLGAWAPAKGTPKGAVLVIHENRGLTDHIRSVAGRLARDGFGALALDLLSAEGGTSRIGDEGKVMGLLREMPQERRTAEMKAALEELRRRVPERKLGIVGFCFGGGQVWQLLQAGEPRLAAAAPFYGPVPENPDFSRSKAAVLAVFAEDDPNVNPRRDAAAAALEKAGVEHEVKTYPGTQHAFFNDTGQRYNAEAAKAVYADLLAWFGKHLA